MVQDFYLKARRNIFPEINDTFPRIFLMIEKGACVRRGKNYLFLDFSRAFFCAF